MTESKWWQITLGPFTNPTSPILFSAPSLSSQQQTTTHFNTNHHFIKKEKKKSERTACQWIHLNNYANQTGDEAFINVREVLHQILLKFIKLLQLKMNIFWLVWCHNGLPHIIFSGCVSAKLPMDLLLKWNMGRERCFVQLEINNHDACFVFCLVFLQTMFSSDFYCFLEN